MMRTAIKRGALRGRVAFMIMSLIMFFLILKKTDVAIEYVERGLKLCARSLIPSLFPFMVASELVLRSGACEAFSVVLQKPFRFLFGIEKEGSSAFLLGIICGFPIGARTAVSLYEEGRISERTFCRLLNFSNVPSAAFVISAVGRALFCSRELGVVLYSVTLISAVCVGVIQNIACKGKKRHGESGKPLCPKGKSQTDVSAETLFSSSVTSAASSMLFVCGFVVFFSVLTGIIENILSCAGLPRPFLCVVVAFFEMSAGAVSAASLEQPLLAVLIAAGAIGWSGLSVHSQIIGICARTGARFGRYFISKAVQALTNVVFVYLYLTLFDKSLLDGIEVISIDASVDLFDVLSPSLTPLSLTVIFAFAVCVCFLVIRKIKG